MTGTMMPKPKKPLKDPNAKSPIQKFFGGKIPHYLAVFAFLFSSYNLFSFQVVKMNYKSLKILDYKNTILISIENTIIMYQCNMH